MAPRICEGCGLPTKQFPALSASCKNKHESNYCTHCCKKYLAVQVFDQRRVPAECVDYKKCGTLLTRDEVKKIANREIMGHYDYLLHLKQAEEDNKIECLATYIDATTGEKKTCRHLLPKTPPTRTTTCPHCETTTCNPCGRIPDHAPETCQSYRTRMHLTHGAEEALTLSALANGYTGLETHSLKPYVHPRLVPHRPLRCPGASCGVLIERMLGGGCAHMVCPLCKAHFCAGCGVGYFGVGGVYDLGNAAHGVGCSYGRREREDWRSVRRRKGDLKEEEGGREGCGDREEEDGGSSWGGGWGR